MDFRKKIKVEKRLTIFPNALIFPRRKSTRRSDHQALGFGFFLGILIGPLTFCTFW
jgi:hypothetical protein